MAQRMKKTEVTTAPSEKKQPTANEVRDFYERNKAQIKSFAAAEQAALSLKDVTKTSVKSVTAFSKDLLRSYLQNIGSNAKNLRNLSRYLFYRCHAYYRWVMYQSTMYDLNCRAVIPNEVKSKYTFSIHINKNTAKSVKGIEVYTPANIKYDFAESIVDNIIEDTELGYSTNRLYKISNGIYTRNSSESDVSSSLDGYEDKGYNPYNVTTNSNYYYMIRETGGYMTGAYIDDSNPDKVGVNPYYDSNIGNETYLLELGYLSNSSDLDIINNSLDDIAKAISDAIIEKFS